MTSGGGEKLDFDVTIDFDGTGFRPTCYPYLESLRESGVVLYHDKYGLRHPVSAYSNTLSRVEGDFIEVLNLFDKLRATKNLFHDASLLLDRYRQLYYALAEHFEACEGIVKSFVPYEEREKHRALKQLSKNKKTYEHVDKVINEIKHRQNELVPIEFKSKFLTIYGFVVSGIRAPDTAGPNLTVHKQWPGPRGNKKIETAFSFNRDLRHIFVDTFRVGALLGEAMDEFGVMGAPSPKREGSRLFEIASRIAKVPDFGFPDELEKERYTVEVKREGDCFRMRVGYGGYHNVPSVLYDPARVHHLIMLTGELSRIVPYVSIS